MKKKLLLVAIIILISFAAFAISQADDGVPTDLNQIFITTNPLDLSQITKISKYRSCVGHDYSGKSVRGEKETLRSMKHYIESKGEDDIKLFAPFDGVVTDYSEGYEEADITLWIEADDAEGWNIIFFHMTPVDGISSGSKVTEGQLVGVAQFNRGGMKGANFDIALKYTSRSFTGPQFDSPFYHMSRDVLAEYKAVGITLENIIYDKVARDNNPCPIIPGTESKYDTKFPSGDRDDDWVRLI